MPPPTLPTSMLISIFSFSVVLLHGMSEADKQYASKGRKEAPPFLEIADGQAPSQAQRATKESIALLDNPQNEKPLQKHLENNDTAEMSAPQSPSADHKMPYFLIFNIPRLTPDQDPDYGWSIWTDWTPCSTKCGVRSRHFRTRHCELPPADDANGCVGEETQWKICDVVPCAGSAKQDRGGEAARETAEWKRPKYDTVSPTGIDLAQRGGEANPSDSKEEEEIVSWHRCASPCPFEIYLRQRWCFVGVYCVGNHREARVCTKRFGLLFCSNVDLANFDPTFDTNGDGQVVDSSSARPWADTRIGWSLWSPWAICSADCFYYVQELNASRPCPENDTGGRTTDCVDGESKDLRICRGEGGGGGGGGGGGRAEIESESSIICGQIEKLSNWKVAEDYKSRNAFASYNGRIVHGIVVLLLFGPLVILIIYWLVTRSRRPRYESLSSAAASSVYANAQSMISTDASSAVGPNHIVVEESAKNWKTA